MLVQIVLPGEVLPAHRTREQLRPRVRHDVPHQVLLPAERLATSGLLALERPQSDVRLEVLHQMFLALERLRAHVTRRKADPAGSGRGVQAAAAAARAAPRIVMATGPRSSRRQVLLDRERRNGLHLLGGRDRLRRQGTCPAVGFGRAVEQIFDGFATLYGWWGRSWRVGLLRFWFGLLNSREGLRLRLRLRSLNEL